MKIIPAELEDAIREVPDLSQFISPFPSNETQLDARWATLIEQIDGGSDLLAAQGANAQRMAMQGCLAVKAQFVGDLRTDWLGELIDIPVILPDGTEKIVGGLFDTGVRFAAGKSPGQIAGSIAAVGLSIAQDFLGAIPFVGNILNAAIGIGKMFAALFRGRTKTEIERRVPWREYSKDTDEYVVRTTLQGTFQTLNWTNLFEPPLEVGRGFELAKAEKDNGWVWGSFVPRGETKLEPDWSGGVGFMPGSQRTISTIQGLVTPLRVSGNVVGIDQWSTTDVGSFLPATAQTLTGIWQMCMRAGNPDMYKVRPQQLLDLWSNYFGAAWEDYTYEYEQLESRNPMRAFLLARMLGSLVVMRDTAGQPWRGAEAYYQAKNVGFFHPRMFTEGPYDTARVSVNCQRGSDCYFARSKQYAYIADAVVIPALKQLLERQHYYLGHSLVAAYVCPESYDDVKAYAAFTDPTHGADGRPRGEVLRERCRDMRDALLLHPDRFKVRLDTVRNVDPRFARELELAGVTENSWKYAGSPATQLHRYVPFGTPDTMGTRPPEPSPEAVSTPEGGYPGEGSVEGTGKTTAVAAIDRRGPEASAYVRTVLGATVLGAVATGGAYVAKKYVVPYLKGK